MKLSVSPDDFAEDPAVKLHLKGIMLILGRFLDFRTGYGFPSQKTLASCAGVTPNIVSRYLRRLTALGYLDVKYGVGGRAEYRLKGGPLRFPFPGPDSPLRANPDSPLRANPDSPLRANPIVIYQPYLINTNNSILSNHARDALLLVLEKHGVRPDQRTEIVACRTETEIRNWVRAVPFYVAETGGKVVKSEAAVLFWALRQSNGPNAKALPAAYVQRRQLDLAGAVNEISAKTNEKTASKGLSRSERLAFLPDKFKTRLELSQ